MIFPMNTEIYFAPLTAPFGVPRCGRHCPVTVLRRGRPPVGPFPERPLADLLNHSFRTLHNLEREHGHSVIATTAAEAKAGNEGAVISDGGFKFTCNVAGYAPEELRVDLDGEELVIAGEHKAQGDDESVHRTFTHRLHLPDTVDKESVVCNVDEHGRLEVRAAPKTGEPKQAKVNIPIAVKEPTTTGEGAKEAVPVEGAKKEQEESATKA